MGGKWRSNEGLELGGKLHQPKTEEEFYSLLNLPFIKPQDRELATLEHCFGKEGACL